jgi:hypothetical protein
MSSSRESGSTIVFPRGTYAAGTTRKRLSLQSRERLTVQWSAFDTNVGVTATIRFYVATVDHEVVAGVDNPLSDTDPVVNWYWALLVDTTTGTPIQFFNEPAGVPASESLPFPSICATEMLVELNVAGGSLTNFLISARLST